MTREYEIKTPPQYTDTVSIVFEAFLAYFVCFLKKKAGQWPEDILDVYMSQSTQLSNILQKCGTCQALILNNSPVKLNPYISVDYIPRYGPHMPVISQD